MKRFLVLVAALGFVAYGASAANAVNLLANGNLDLQQAVEVVPGFFLPKPASWENIGTRSISGPYEDEMSSEPWAGPAPTPVTTDNLLNPPAPEACGNNLTDGDCGVFFKPFSGSATNGLATGHLQQAVPGTAGLTYVLTGWAGAEANAMMQDAVFAIDFLNGSGGIISSSQLSLMSGLFVDIGNVPFDYKQYTVTGVAPAGTVSVQARASMIGAQANPLGGGQAFVVDDFTLEAVPEPATVALGLLGVCSLIGLRRRG